MPLLCPIPEHSLVPRHALPSRELCHLVRPRGLRLFERAHRLEAESAVRVAVGDLIPAGDALVDAGELRLDPARLGDTLALHQDLPPVATPPDVSASRGLLFVV